MKKPKISYKAGKKTKPLTEFEEFEEEENDKTRTDERTE